MNLLLDTHAVIWFVTENEKVPEISKQHIENSDNICFI